MKKIKLVGAVTGRVYEVDPSRLSIDDKTGIKFVKTATEFAFEVVEVEKKEVKKETPAPKKTTPKAKPVEVKEEVKTEKEAE